MAYATKRMETPFAKMSKNLLSILRAELGSGRVKSEFDFRHSMFEMDGNRYLEFGEKL